MLPVNLKLCVGTCPSTDPDEAGREAVTEALRTCESPAAALVFATDQYDPATLARVLNRALGDVPWAGCCTAGVFARSRFFRQGVVVGLFSSAELRVGIGVGGPVSDNPREAGRAAVAEALTALPSFPTPGQRAVIVLPDALTGNAAEVVRGAAQEAGSGVVWAGGGSGDNLRYFRTAQFARGQAFNDRVVVIAIDSPAPLATGIRHGWRPYGRPALVTRAQGPVAVELEYEPAFQVYRREAASRGDEVTPERFAAFAMTHPFGIPQANGEFLIRDPLDLASGGSIRCTAEIPDGSMVRVMEGDRDALLAASAAAATSAREALPGALAGAVVFDCVSRFLVLGEGIEDELSRIAEGLGPGVPLMGCLTFGEVGAMGAGMPQFHNKTAVVLAFAR